MKCFVMAMMSALMLSTVACSSSDEDADDKRQPEVPEEPAGSEYLTPGTDGRPTWQVDGDLYQRYELTMSVHATVQDELLPYVSTDDLMCVRVNGELRAVSQARISNGESIFSLVVAGAGNDRFLSVSYYCAKLRRIYTLDRWMLFLQSFEPTLANGRPHVVTFF